MASAPCRIPHCTLISRPDAIRPEEGGVTVASPALAKADKPLDPELHWVPSAMPWASSSDPQPPGRVPPAGES